ncbi:hypothetical protein ACKA06_02430 [Rossellomorea oryzaecorticis]|uniref:Uncharacterized protein n=1 Tax=Rossellomorea oryzaecorticis TaxID=1396505 RepID=A0ABW8VJP7_9BACI
MSLQAFSQEILFRSRVQTLEGNDRDFYVGYMEVIGVLDAGDEMAALA